MYPELVDMVIHGILVEKISRLCLLLVKVYLMVPLLLLLLINALIFGKFFVSKFLC